MKLKSRARFVAKILEPARNLLLRLQPGKLPAAHLQYDRHRKSVVFLMISHLFPSIRTAPSLILRMPSPLDATMPASTISGASLNGPGPDNISSGISSGIRW